jgi:hypothetical protein
MTGERKVEGGFRLDLLDVLNSGRKGTGDREGRSGPRTRAPAAIGGV